MSERKTHLFCDESGNTGLDLFNEAQPVFSLASTCLEAEAAEDLIGPLRKRGQKEVKYSSLKNSPLGQRKLLEFFSSPILDASNSGFTLTDKKYYVITHLVDKVIEPPLHEAGLDLYERDGHVGLARVWYYTGHTIFQSGHWAKVLDAFLVALRRRDQKSYDGFDAVLTRAMSASVQGSRDFAVGLFLARGRLNEFIGVYKDVETFDPAVDAFIYLVQSWMQRWTDWFQLTHDRSKPLKHRESFLRVLMSQVATRKIGYANRQTELPLRISSLDFGDSRLHSQIQVADVIAGASVDATLVWSKRKHGSDYHEKLRETKLNDLFLGGLLPIFDITPDDPPKPGEVSLCEGAAQFLRDVGHFNKPA